jgi:ribosomal protein S18 acetylase RimI-like enzyme
MGQLTIREASPDDAAAVAAMLAGLSADSCRRRFFSVGPAGPRAELTWLTTVDGHDRVALVAEGLDGRVVGLARFHRPPGGAGAELAVVVADEWQGCGLGRSLVATLAVAARSSGVSAFDVSILGDNVAALGLVRRLSPGVSLALDHGVWEGHVPLAA